MKRSVPTFVCCAAAALFLTYNAFAQIPTSTVRGTVVDPRGGIVVGAAVEIINSDGQASLVRTDSRGEFLFSGLPPGGYILRVTAPGFAASESEVTLSAGETRLADTELRIASASQEITVTATPGLSLENTGTALVLREDALEGLAGGPGGLPATLRLLAIRSAGFGGPQILVDGFGGGRLPSTASIREIRIHQNPFSAEYDQPGLSRVEIRTRPGMAALRSTVYSIFNDESMNSRNPFAADRPPFQSRLYGGNIGGPLVSGRASFFVEYERRQVENNAVVNATILDPLLNVTPLELAVVTPQHRTNVGQRLEFQLGANHTLITRYVYDRSVSRNSGIGDFSLPSRAFDSWTEDHTAQLTETAMYESVVNETRIEYRRHRRVQDGHSSIPTLRVPEAFVGGGSDVGRSVIDQHQAELQNHTSWIHGRHSSKFGIDVRGVQLTDTSRFNFGGTYTFGGRAAPELDAAGEIVTGEDGQAVMTAITTIESYRRTRLFEQLGLDPAAARARGGGPVQFSIAGGNPTEKATQLNGGAFFQNDWRLSDGLTLSLGLRYEAQTNIRRSRDIAPRFGLAWAPGDSPTPKQVIRGGFGIFYERIGENLILRSRRFNGINQQRFIVADEAILSLFPQVPDPVSLAEFAVPQTARRIAHNLSAPYLMQSSLSIERELTQGMTIAATLRNSRALHLLRSRNINAPLPGTDGVRPFEGAGPIFEYESSGVLDSKELVVNLVNRLGNAFTYYVTYILNRAESDTDGPETFPADSHSLIPEYGRSALDVRHTFYWGTWLRMPLGLNLTSTVVRRSGLPFNITTGRDNNGDSVFTDRPAFASGPDGPGLVGTPFGAFDIQPSPGQPVIPRNFAQGPPFTAVNLRVGRTWAFRSVGGRRQSVVLAVQAYNLFNRTNPGIPIGNLSSPRFGRSYFSAGDYGLGNNPAGNRRVEAQIYFNF